VHVEIDRRNLRRRRPRCPAALVAGCAAQQLLLHDPSGYAGRQPRRGHVIGLWIAFYASFSALGPEWRLFVMTGFCGGFTTVSTFSAEGVALLQRGRALPACGAIAVHMVGGSVVMTCAGIGTVVWVRS